MGDASWRAELPRIHYERHAGAAAAPLASGYRRREPEKTTLHILVRSHLETFLQEARERDGDGYPRFVEREFRRYLDCGLLQRGFARLRCPQCTFERLVAFSCKGRLCPSCMGRRMADIAAYLVDDILPEAPYRQWVLTFPWLLRFRLAVDRPLFGKLLGTFLRTVFAWQRRRGRALGILEGQTGSVSFLQRFGGAMNLNPHVHSLLPDGLFVPGHQDSDALTFVPLPEPTQEDIEALTQSIARRLTGAIERLGEDESETQAALERTASALREALAKAVGQELPRPGLDFQEVEPDAMRTPLCAKIAGFSLHAARVVHAPDRHALESLCRYGLRAPFAQDRLTLQDDGRVLYHLRRPWPNAQGATCLVLQPTDLLRRLAALVPAPYANLVRYHGVFAGRSRWRARLPKPPARDQGAIAQPLPQPQLEPENQPENRPAPVDLESAAPPPAPLPDPPTRRRRGLPWAKLLLRVLGIDALACPRCARPMVVLALISDPDVVRKILLHLELPAEVPPLEPACPTGDDVLHFDAAFDDDPARPPP